MKSLIATICIVSIIGLTMGFVTRADEEPITATVTPINISINRSVGDGSIAYGYVDLNTEADSTAEVQTYNNNGNQAAEVDVATSNAVDGTDWIPDTANSVQDHYIHSFSTTSPQTWQILDAAASYEFASTTMDVGANLDIYLKIKTPQSVTAYDAKTITVTVRASAI